MLREMGGVEKRKNRPERRWTVRREKDERRGNGLNGRRRVGRGRNDGEEFRARKVSVVYALEGFGIRDGGFEGDEIALLAVGKRGRRGGDVIEGVIGVFEVYGVFGGDFTAIGEEGFDFVGGERENGGGECMAGVYGEGAGGGVGVCLSGDREFDLVIDGGKDGIGKRAEGVRGAVTCFEGFGAVE